MPQGVCRLSQCGADADVKLRGVVGSLPTASPACEEGPWGLVGQAAGVATSTATSTAPLLLCPCQDPLPALSLPASQEGKAPRNKPTPVLNEMSLKKLICLGQSQSSRSDEVKLFFILAGEVLLAFACVVGGHQTPNLPALYGYWASHDSMVFMCSLYKMLCFAVLHYKGCRRRQVGNGAAERFHQRSRKA